ncbi:DUF1657 domain-containing protein [Siminovitchia fortis]|uniref:DUF1657 domain-containing protein n=1 Tax=Siminovitchia fortis TaxID=254758 RepID=A0A443IPK6_9BACI|nr:DUF1657 domain-containing protein [Siminovitchia fortis]RWR08451.1 DUF1657 domain-containing protein [Siminovitchia fortis]WHY83073.1 DUF1657 domain-containing protein [Siminovitchia fortis]
MTVISDVKTTLATMKGIQASFSKLAMTSTDQEAKKIFHECMMETEPIISDLQKRVEYMMAEELQYKNS